MNLTNNIAPWLQKPGVWGPVTATLDWCELNHQFSPYIAEMANTFSNLFTVAISLIGCFHARKQGLPSRYVAGYAGVALVGIGSFFFHATLLFEAQLADELPMIYVGSMSLFLLFDSGRGFNIHNARSQLLVALLVAFDVGFTWSYSMIWRNPIYHQCVFAFTVISTTLRVAYILHNHPYAHTIPKKKKDDIINFFSSGAVTFALGFVVWNLDNVFCERLTGWKVHLGWPGAFLLEGHSWWHILTGLGTYLMFIGIQFVTLCVKDDPKKYEVHYRHGLPHIRRSPEYEAEKVKVT